MKRFSSAVLAVSVCVFSGCGAADIQQFVGFWNTSGSATMTYNIPGVEPRTTSLNGSLAIIEGTDSDIVLSMADCNLPAMVKGEIATVRTGHTCVSQNGEYTVTLNFMGGNATVNQDTMAFNANGPLSVVVNGQTYTGTFSFAQNATRVGR